MRITLPHVFVFENTERFNAICPVTGIHPLKMLFGAAAKIVDPCAGNSRYYVAAKCFVEDPQLFVNMLRTRTALFL